MVFFVVEPKARTSESFSTQPRIKTYFKVFADHVVCEIQGKAIAFFFFVFFSNFNLVHCSHVISFKKSTCVSSWKLFSSCFASWWKLLRLKYIQIVISGFFYSENERQRKRERKIEINTNADELLSSSVTVNIMNKLNGRKTTKKKQTHTHTHFPRLSSRHLQPLLFD